MVISFAIKFYQLMNDIVGFWHLSRPRFVAFKPLMRGKSDAKLNRKLSLPRFNPLWFGPYVTHLQQSYLLETWT